MAGSNHQHDDIIDAEFVVEENSSSKTNSNSSHGHFKNIQNFDFSAQERENPNFSSQAFFWGNANQKAVSLKKLNPLVLVLLSPVILAFFVLLVIVFFLAFLIFLPKFIRIFKARKQIFG